MTALGDHGTTRLAYPGAAGNGQQAVHFAKRIVAAAGLRGYLGRRRGHLELPSAETIHVTPPSRTGVANRSGTAHDPLPR